MRWHHLLLVALVIIIIFSMLVWALFDDPAPEIEEQNLPSQLNETN